MQPESGVRLISPSRSLSLSLTHTHTHTQYPFPPEFRYSAITRTSTLAASGRSLVGNRKFRDHLGR